MPSTNCPNCGSELALHRADARMADCPACGTTCFLALGGPEPVGQHGDMTEAPTLLGLGRRAWIGGLSYLPVGHARFDYGRGFWDEFWCTVGGEQEGRWVSTDEGDVVIEEPLASGSAPAGFFPRLGAEVRVRLPGRGELPFRVTEIESATCLAVRGEFPELLVPGERFLFADLLGPAGEALTWEKSGDDTAWFGGRWVDPFDVREAG